MEELLLPAERVQLKRCILSSKVFFEIKIKETFLFSKRDTLPPICTHNMVDDVSDPVLNAFRRCQLFNYDHDRVKV